MSRHLKLNFDVFFFFFIFVSYVLNLNGAGSVIGVNKQSQEIVFGSKLVPSGNLLVVTYHNTDTIDTFDLTRHIYGNSVVFIDKNHQFVYSKLLSLNMPFFGLILFLYQNEIEQEFVVLGIGFKLSIVN